MNRPRRATEIPEEPKKGRLGLPSRRLPAQPCHFEQASRKGHPAHAMGDGDG